MNSRSFRNVNLMAPKGTIYVVHFGKRRERASKRGKGKLKVKFEYIHNMHMNFMLFIEHTNMRERENSTTPQ